MGDDAGYHQLPFRVRCSDYALLPANQPFPAVPQADWIYTILIRGGFSLQLGLFLLRRGGRFFLALCHIPSPARLQRLHVSQPRLCAHYEPGRPSTHPSFQRPGSPFYLVDREQQPPVRIELFALPDGLGPPPQPHQHYALCGRLSFRLARDPDLLQLSTLPSPPSPVPASRLGAYIVGHIEHGLAGLRAEAQVEIRCADERSLYLRKDQVYLFTEASHTLSAALSDGALVLEHLADCPALVVLRCLEALLHGWFQDLGRLAWPQLLQTAVLLCVYLQLSYPPLARQLRGQLERALVAAVPSGAQEAQAGLSLAQRCHFRLLANRCLVALAQAPDLHAWLHRPADGQLLHAAPDYVRRSPHARSVLALLAMLRQAPTRPFPFP